VFENNYSPHIPTTSGYANMLTGRDVFGTQVVALRHQGDMRPEATTLPRCWREAGYISTCVGFSNPAARGFDTYVDFEGWGAGPDGFAHKAENLNAVALPELERLAAQDHPFLLFLRHMDPHTPYLPPPPFQRMFYHGDECDPANRSMDPVFTFKPFCDYFASWMPPGITDAEYEVAQYDAAVAYMDSCLQNVLTAADDLGLTENTIVVFTSDHGETLYDHECWFDHHGTYENTLHVPMAIRAPGQMPAGKRVAGFSQLKDLVPTLLELCGIAAPEGLDGHSLLPLATGAELTHETEIYFTECTWMRKHGWRTPEWKLIVALEPGLPLQAAGGAVPPAHRPRREHQSRRGAAGHGRLPARAHGGLDREARAGDRPDQPDSASAALARGPEYRVLYFLAAGLRHAAHRRRRSRGAPAGPQAGRGPRSLTWH